LKSEFLSSLDLRDIDDNKAMVISDLIYRSEIYNGIIIVPEGFITDKASVPRVPIIYMAFGDRSHRESVIHDYLYKTGIVSKVKADRIFLEAMKARAKPLWVRWGMYLGVVVGAYPAWWEHRAKN
jgi:hypothetical protein